MILYILKNTTTSSSNNDNINDSINDFVEVWDTTNVIQETQPNAMDGELTSIVEKVHRLRSKSLPGFHMS